MRGWLRSNKTIGALCALVGCGGVGVLHAQDLPHFYTVQPRVGFYQMPENGWVPLTLHLTALDLEIHRDPKTSLYLGPRMAGNFLGVRAGYISLGGHAGLTQRLNPHWRLRAEINATAGGGGYAQDGDGWVLGTLSSIQYQSKRRAFEAGITYHYASGGKIGGFSPYLGWSNALTVRRTPSEAVDSRPLNLSVGLFAQPSVGRRPYGDPQGSTDYPFTMVGAELRIQGTKVYHALSVSAAADTFGGYMLVINTLSPRMLVYGPAALRPQLHLGAGGGGRSIHYYGGLHAGLGIEASLSFRGIEGYASYALMRTNGPWSYQARQFGLRMPLVLARAPYSPSEQPTHRAASRYVLEVGLGTKLYRNDSLWAACVGGEATLLRSSSISLRGSTWWAALGGNLGAYAEGLLDLDVRLHKGLHWSASAGLGAGGGINHLGDSYVLGTGIEFGERQRVRIQVWQGAPTRWSFTWVRHIQLPVASAVL